MKDILDANEKPVNFSSLQSIEYFGLSIKVPEDVYGPMEDTDLSISFLRNWIKEKKISLNSMNLKILEIGCGSGVLSIFLAKKLSEMKVKFAHLGIDINPYAVKTSIFNAEQNKIDNLTKFVQGDLLSPLQNGESLSDGIKRDKFDLILCNPPYCVSEPETINESNRKLIDLSWEGGVNGYDVTLRLFDQLSPFLSENTEMFIISSGSVDQEPILEKIKDLGMIIVKKYEKHVFFEDIYLYHLAKSKDSRDTSEND